MRQQENVRAGTTEVLDHEPPNLAEAGPGNFRRTRSRYVEALWIMVEYILVSNPLQVSSRLQKMALRMFGADIGPNVLTRPRLRVKFPWNLKLGANCWLGEGVWIHNQAPVMIEDNVIISQETFITTGSHDVRKTMDLVVKPVSIRRGAWVTSRCVVLQGVNIGENVVVTPCSVVHKSLSPNQIYGGNPLRWIRPRWTEED
jgi:putative colanic acid biosynthesis acetyltransferase WcaF